MPSSQDLSGGGHGHGRRGEENKNGRGRETDLHTTTMMPPWHRHNEAGYKPRNGQRRGRCRKYQRTAEHGSEQDASRQRMSQM